MKRCPECRRDYYDDTLNYCLSDGTELVYGLAPDEPATAILSEFGAPPLGGSSSKSATMAQVLTTDQTTMLQPSATEGGSDSRRMAKPLIATVAVLAVAGIGFGIYKFAFKKDTAAPSFESMKITKLTDTGKAGNAVISPDGKPNLFSRGATTKDVVLISGFRK